MAKGVFGVALSEAEVERLFRAIDLATFVGRRDEALYRVLLETGMPIRAALALRLCDVDSVPGLRDVLGDYLAYNSTLTDPGPEGFLFPPLDHHAPVRKIRIVPEKAITMRLAEISLHKWAGWAGLDLSRVTLSSLRYTGAARLIEAGASPRQIAKFLQMTLRNSHRVCKRLKQVGRADPGVKDGHTGPYIYKSRGFHSGHMLGFRNAATCRRYQLSRFGFSRGSPNHIPFDDWPQIREGLARLLGEISHTPYKTHHDGLLLALKAVEIGQALALGQARWVDHVTGIDSKRLARNQLRRYRARQKREYKQWLDYLKTCCETSLGREVLFYYWKNGELDYLLPEHLQRGELPPEGE